MSILLIPYAVINGMLGDYGWNHNFVHFMILGISGGIVSILLGITLTLSPGQFLSVPVSLILGFGPQFAAQNETLAMVFRYTFIMQVNLALAEPDYNIAPNLTIIAANGAVILAAFAFMHRKNKFNI